MRQLAAGGAAGGGDRVADVLAEAFEQGHQLARRARRQEQPRHVAAARPAACIARHRAGRVTRGIEGQGHEAHAITQRRGGGDRLAHGVEHLVGARAALRQAPKVILVGEMRDRETVQIALSAAETGHLVLSTLHTIDAGQTINRILGLFESEEQEQIRLVVATTGESPLTVR